MKRMRTFGFWKKRPMEAETENVVQRVIDLLGHVRNFRCRYQDLSLDPHIDAGRIVEVRGEQGGLLHLRTVSGVPDAETYITDEQLIRVDYTNRNGYRIDFSRHPFTDFHRFGWLRLDRPFALFDPEELRFRGEILESVPTLLFQGELNAAFFGEWSPSSSLPTAQFKLDAKTGLLRELLILSGTSLQRFLFTGYSVNGRFDKRPRAPRPPWEIGDMTDLYWNQICGAKEGSGPSAPFFSLN